MGYWLLAIGYWLLAKLGPNGSPEWNELWALKSSVCLANSQ
jgi:hypothetical protein